MTQIIFDKSSVNWTENMEYNIMFVKHVELYLNDFIKAKGGVYGHEIYDQFGIPYNRLLNDPDCLTSLFVGYLKFGAVSFKDKIVIEIYSPEDLILLEN